MKVYRRDEYRLYYIPRTRGSFIVIEGIDGSGKTTLGINITEYLAKAGESVYMHAFPDRSTKIGKLLDEYLKNTSHFDSKLAHLLFSANRWEFFETFKKRLLSGQSIILDRYVYSGIAYSMANGLSHEWCIQSDKGLIEPDLIINIDANPSCIKQWKEKERYETISFQWNVYYAFKMIADPSWIHIEPYQQNISFLMERIKQSIMDCVSGKKQLNFL